MQILDCGWSLSLGSNRKETFLQGLLGWRLRRGSYCPAEPGIGLCVGVWLLLLNAGETISPVSQWKSQPSSPCSFGLVWHCPANSPGSAFCHGIWFGFDWGFWGFVVFSFLCITMMLKQIIFENYNLPYMNCFTTVSWTTYLRRHNNFFSAESSVPSPCKLYYLLAWVPYRPPLMKLWGDMIEKDFVDEHNFRWVWCIRTLILRWKTTDFSRIIQGQSQ